MKLEPSDWISIASVVIALSAMGVAIWQGYVSRKHNILSVRPRLQVHLDGRNGIVLTLQNHGLGPAIVKGFSIKYAGEEIVNPKADPYLEIFKSLDVDPFEKGFQYEFHLPFEETTYVPGQNKRLLEIIPIKDTCDDQVLLKICEGIRVEIDYTCMYEDKEFSCRG
ncbi:hypothetical protein [Marinobacter alexandrii]|uniref:hypothetical protein n=1 Tax=Marinobacter alexandrii TaxID=2570351 RepID=UPI0032679515